MTLQRRLRGMRPALPSLILLVLGAAGAAGQRPGIRGVVRDFADDPLPDVEVIITGTNLRTTTNVRGEFFFDDLSPKTYFMLVRRPGYAPARMQVPVGGTEITQVEVVLKQVPYTLEPLIVNGTRRGLYGVVGDTSYHPALGAKVEILGGGEVAYTDSLGRFNFPDLKPGTYMVRASLPGWLAKPVFVELPRNESRELVIFLGREPLGYQKQPGMDAALTDLGSRLAFNPRQSRMTASELERYQGRPLCEVAKIRSLTGTDTPLVIVNGVDVLRNWPLCGWSTDEISLIEWGSNPCTDRTGSVADALGLVCGGGRGASFGYSQADKRSGTLAGGFVLIWTKQ